MHTPGQELFDGVLHPSAALFERYFDVEKAAEEHQAYIRLLEANGIRVHTVTGILNEVSLDTLRMLASQELIYDINAMPDEEKAAAEAYRQKILSQMSRADLIRCILLRPVVRLFPEVLSAGSLGAEEDRFGCQRYGTSGERQRRQRLSSRECQGVYDPLPGRHGLAEPAEARPPRRKRHKKPSVLREKAFFCLLFGNCGAILS